MATDIIRLTPGFRKVIALSPIQAGRELLTPIFFDVATTTGEVHCQTVSDQLAVNGMIHADDTMVTLHERHPGEPAHGTW